MGKIGKKNLSNAQQDIIHLSPFHFLLAYQRENYNRKGGFFCDGFDIDVEISYGTPGNETAENTTMPITEPPWPGYENK